MQKGEPDPRSPHASQPWTSLPAGTNPRPPRPADAEPNAAAAESPSCLRRSPLGARLLPPRCADRRGAGFSYLLKGIFRWQKAFLAAEGKFPLFSLQGSSSLCEE